MVAAENCFVPRIVRPLENTVLFYLDFSQTVRISCQIESNLISLLYGLRRRLSSELPTLWTSEVWTDWDWNGNKCTVLRLSFSSISAPCITTVSRCYHFEFSTIWKISFSKTNSFLFFYISIEPGNFTSSSEFILCNRTDRSLNLHRKREEVTSDSHHPASVICSNSHSFSAAKSSHRVNSCDLSAWLNYFESWREAGWLVSHWVEIRGVIIHNENFPYTVRRESYRLSGISELSYLWAIRNRFLNVPLTCLVPEWAVTPPQNSFPFN